MKLTKLAMNKCPICLGAYDKQSCIDSTLVDPEGNVYHRDNTYFDENDACHDCGVENKVGNYHHYQCDVERCPKCGGQLIGLHCDLKYEFELE